MAIVPLCLLPLLAIYFGARQATRDAHRAMHDALTGSRTACCCATGSSACSRQAGEPLVLMIVDLDDFKAVNDTLGHAAATGSCRRSQPARRRAAPRRHARPPRRRRVRRRSSPARPGRGRAARHAAGRRARRALRARRHGHSTSRASVGFAASPRARQRPPTTCSAAPTSRSTARSPPGARSRSTRRPRTTTASTGCPSPPSCAAGIEAGEIILEYQPKFPLAAAGDRRRGARPLAAPDLGRIGPDGFVPLADQAGLMAADRRGAARGARAVPPLARRRARAAHVRQPLPRSLSDPRAAAAGSRRCWPPRASRRRSLQLEITESRALPSGRGATRVADELRAMGVGIAIDDFGTGFSSLVQLQRLPVDEIKIDRSFVATMAHDAERRGDRALHDRPRAQPRPARHRRGRGDRGGARSLPSMGCELAQGYGLVPARSAPTAARASCASRAHPRGRAGMRRAQRLAGAALARRSPPARRGRRRAARRATWPQIVVLRRRDAPTPSARSTALARILGIKLEHRYGRVLDGFAADLTAAQVARARGRPAVAFVEPDAVVTPGRALATRWPRARPSRPASAASAA